MNTRPQVQKHHPEFAPASSVPHSHGRTYFHPSALSIARLVISEVSTREIPRRFRRGAVTVHRWLRIPCDTLVLCLWDFVGPGGNSSAVPGGPHRMAGLHRVFEAARC